MFNLQKGDYAIVFGPWAQPGRFIREEATAKALEDGGLTVERIESPPEWATDPTQATPVLSAAVLAHPEVKVVVWPGGQQLGVVPLHMETLKKKPGEIYNIGFDTSPAIIDAFAKGYVQLTSDQQPFEQGYLPILSLCLSWKLGLGPMNVDTGAGFVTADNYQTVAEWANKGYR
jgi:simple sugar transport system substrate-binding protein